MIGPDTLVLPFLNGVEASERLARILPPGNVAKGVARVSTTIAAPGVIKQTGAFNSFIFAESYNRPSERVGALRQAINTFGSSAPATDENQHRHTGGIGVARAQRARAQMALAFETTYGTPLASGFTKMPFASTTLDAEQPLLNSELLG